MKNTLKIVLALTLICALLLSGCQTEPETTDPAVSEAVYGVTVVDGDGQPYTTGIIVEILQDGNQVLMQPINESGKVEKTLPVGDYTVQLRFTAGAEGYHFDDSDLTLSAEKTQLQVQVLPVLGGESVPVRDNEGQTEAWNVETGSVYVALQEGKRNYFLFAPKMAGTYRFTTSDPNAAIGNYGYTAYIQDKSITEVKDNVFLLSVGASMVSADGSNPLVIGVDANGVDNCVLSIQRIGDPEYSIEENEPWIIYKPTADLKPYTMPEGTLQEFDLTADGYTLVFNEADQSYHLNTADGPQVLVRLSVPTKYLTEFSTICTTTGIKKYFYDDDGEFVKREDYTECMQTYCNLNSENGKPVYVDVANGVYPLTEDLKYILQNHGEYAGWWDVDSPGFIFMDGDENALVGLNPDIAWLFACCYLETDGTPVPTDPTLPETPTDPDKPTQPTNKPATKPTTRPVTPTDPTQPTNKPATKPTTAPTKPDEPTTPPVVLGSKENPAALTIGSNTAQVNGSYYFTWTAGKNAVLELKRTSGSWKYEVQNLTGGSALTKTGSSDSVQVNVVKGDKLLIIVKANGTVRFNAAVTDDLNGTKAEPYVVLPDESASIRVGAGQTVYMVGRVYGTTMSIENAADSKLVFELNEQTYTYTPKKGVISLDVPMAKPGQAGTQVVFELTNNSNETKTYNVEFVVPKGTFANPEELTLGTHTVKVENANEGYYLTWTAASDGVLTLKMEGNDWYYQLQNLSSYVVEEGNSEDNSANPVSIEVKAGEVIRITLNTNATAGKVTFTASFQ